jgi:hypothetical protein
MPGGSVANAEKASIAQRGKISYIALECLTVWRW